MQFTILEILNNLNYQPNNIKTAFSSQKHILVIYLSDIKVIIHNNLSDSVYIAINIYFKEIKTGIDHNKHIMEVYYLLQFLSPRSSIYKLNIESVFFIEVKLAIAELYPFADIRFNNSGF